MTKIRFKNPSPDPTLSEMFWQSISQHRTCWMHAAAYHCHHERKITLRELGGIKKRLKPIYPCMYRAFPHRKRSIRKENNGTSTQANRKKLHNVINLLHMVPNNGRSKHKSSRSISACVKSNKLDTSTFELYMENLWRSFTEDKRISFDYLDSLWFSLYRDASSKPKVLKWIKMKGIFTKKYVFVPIVCWGHWSLLIFVHFGESLNSETGRPCMLLLDSMEAADPRRLEPEIRKFVADIYKVEGRAQDTNSISKIPLLIPKVPQQRDDVECGNYVLYFISLFMESAPENFSISKGYPYFMKQDWFDTKSFEHFCNKLKELCRH